MNKCVTINSNVQRIYVTELYLFYINDVAAIVLYCSRAQPADLNLSTLLHHLLLIFSHASDMPHHLSASISSPARRLHQPMLCLRFSAYQTAHGNSNGEHGVCAPPVYAMLEVLSIPSAHGE